MTWGLWRPRVLVPGSAENWSDARRRMVLVHEGAHIKRGDALTQLVGSVACGVYWFHPLVWYAKYSARLEAEHACDDVVVAASAGSEAVKASAYATELLTISEIFRAPAPYAGAAIAMARGRGGQLHSRIRAILDSARNRRELSVRRTAVGVILAAGVVVSLSVLRAADVEGQKSEDVSHVVHFEVGDTQFLAGDSITISEIRSGVDAVTVGNTYQVKGTYTLASANEANLAVYVTALTRDDTHRDPYDSRQTVHIKKGTGSFTVVLPFLSKGHPHLSFYPMGGGESFSALYFGTGESVEPKESVKRARPPTVTVLVSPDGISFEGKGTTWEDLPGLLEKVEDRPNKVLAFAFTSDTMPIRDFYSTMMRVLKLKDEFHFKYMSDQGIKPAAHGGAMLPMPDGVGNGMLVILDMSGTSVCFVRGGKVHLETGKQVLEGESVSIIVPVKGDERGKSAVVDVQDGKVRLRAGDGSVLIGDRIEVSTDGQMTAKGGIFPAVENALGARRVTEAKPSDSPSVKTGGK